MIAKAAITAVRVVFITHDEDTTNLNGIWESYLLFFTPVSLDCRLGAAYIC
jgi:hypothetical protein